MKKILTFLAVFFFAVSLLSCGGPSEKTETSKSSSGDEIIADKSPKKAYKEATKIEDPVEKIAQFRKIIKSFPESQVVFHSGRKIFETGIENTSDTKQIKKYISEYTDSAPEDKKSFAYNDIAYKLARKNILLSEAEKYASKALNLARKEKSDDAVGNIYDTVALVYKKQNKIDKALENQAKAVKKLSYNHDILKRYGEMLQETNKTEKAVDIYARAVSVFGEKDKELKKKLKKLYVKVNGSKEGLSDKLTKLKEQSKNYEIIEKRKVDKPAPNWTAPYLKDGKVSLSDLEGKIVVLNFWGAWCGWCKKELPEYQKVYKNYNDQEVVFLAINVEFSGTKKEKEKKVKKYLKSNDFTFPVVMDYENQLPEKYGVKGFPTSFVVGKDGNLKFENRGYSPKYKEILKTQIEHLI